jgi:hypothetical protein
LTIAIGFGRPSEAAAAADDLRLSQRSPRKDKSFLLLFRQVVAFVEGSGGVVCIARLGEAGDL